MYGEIMCSRDNDQVIDDPTLLQLRPNASEYERIDSVLLTMPHLITDHAIHDSLSGDRKIAVYEIYKQLSTNDLMCIIKFGCSVNGHPGIVHGGITSLLFDNSFGWAFFARKIKPGFTANLNVNFRKPVYAGSYAVLKARIEKQEGRKTFLSASLVDHEGSLLAEATSLFISPAIVVSQTEPIASSTEIIE